jgi:hypothetical protein
MSKVSNQLLTANLKHAMASELSKKRLSKLESDVKKKNEEVES